MSKIYRYIWISGGYEGDVHGPPFIFCLLFKKTEKSTRAWPLLKSNSTSLWFFFFLGRIIKNLHKGAPLLFLYEVSIVVLIDFIAILLIPCIFLIHVVNTNNTNVYLIHFHSKNNIQMHFPKSWVFKVSNQSQSFIATRWNKLRWHQQRLHNNVSLSDFQKNNLINYYY